MSDTWFGTTAERTLKITTKAGNSSISGEDQLLVRKAAGSPYIYVPSGFGTFEEILSQKGAVLNGTADDADFVQEAVNTAMVNGKIRNLNFPDVEKMKINKRLTFIAPQCSFDLRGMTIDASGILVPNGESETSAILLTGTAVPPNNRYSNVCPLKRFKLLGKGQVTLAVTTTSGSATATMPSTASLVVGMVVWNNPNIPAGTTVLSITNGTSFVMSANATGSAGSVSTYFQHNLAVDGIVISGDIGQIPGHGALEDIYIDGFRDGLSLGPNYYIAQCRNVFSRSNLRANLNFWGPSNAGESMGFFGGSFSDARNATGTAVGILIPSTAGEGTLNFFSTSNSYNDLGFDIGAAKVYFSGCFFESKSMGLHGRASYTSARPPTSILMDSPKIVHGPLSGGTETAEGRPAFFEWTTGGRGSWVINGGGYNGFERSNTELLRVVAGSPLIRIQGLNCETSGNHPQNGNKLGRICGNTSLIRNGNFSTLNTNYWRVNLPSLAYTATVDGVNPNTTPGNTNTSVSLNVTTTSGSNSATTTSTASLVAGMTLSGNANVPVGTTVQSITNGTTFVMSANATGTGSAVSTTASTGVSLKIVGTGLPASTVLNVSTTSGSATATVPNPQTQQLFVGMVISGNANIPAGTTVTSINGNGTTFNMSANATATNATVSTTFTGTGVSVVGTAGQTMVCAPGGFLRVRGSMAIESYTSGGVFFRARFFSDNDTLISTSGSDISNLSTTKAWTTYGNDFSIPAGTKYATVDVYLGTFIGTMRLGDVEAWAL